MADGISQANVEVGNTVSDAIVEMTVATAATVVEGCLDMVISAITEAYCVEDRREPEISS